MFGTYSYHQRIRKSVAMFGKMFNDIYIVRRDASGNQLNTQKVPLTYAPKRKFLDRIRENPDLYEDTKVAIKLPRMSFEIVSFNYDPSVQLQKTNNFNIAGTASTNRNKFNAFVPYIINFQLSIYAKNQDDALQVVEQVIPFFNPQYTLTIKPFDDYPTIKEDVPITLTGVTFTDDYEGALEARRTIIYTLDFDMKVRFYGPVGTQQIIRQVDANIYNMNAGLNDSDLLIETIRVTPDPIDASPDSDYGFNTLIIGWDDSA
jgi:hypothetical protein